MDDVYHICNNKKLEHQFLSDADMKRKRPKPVTNPGTQQVGVSWGAFGADMSML